ncbi:MAG: adenosylmethionine--8-amino-7-oxononanoate transaminase [Nitrospinae bacterium]|nr:adenosylmethionine--8-amino-7-oxononanoate transaminase [Nitrospinota bacterium]
MRHKGLFIAGTGTSVGKTTAAGAIAHLMRQNSYDVGVMKPVSTGTPLKDGRQHSPDLDFVREMAQTEDKDDLALPYSFSTPASPFHAAMVEGRRIEPSRIHSAFKAIFEGRDLVIAEGAGGLMAPLTEEVLWADIVKLLGIPALIVSPAGLGMVHQAISTVMAAEVYGIEMAGLLVVETDAKLHPPIDQRLLERHTELPLLGILPFCPALARKRPDLDKFREHVEEHLKIERLIDFLERSGSKAAQKRLEREDKAHVWHPFTQQSEWEKESILIAGRGSGTKITDLHGNPYLDGHSSYWVNLHGHGHPRLTRTLAKQAGKLEHATFLGLSNQPAIELAGRLTEITPASLKKVFYSDNGSTAVEAAMKMAVQYWRQTLGKRGKKTKFMALRNAYHGDTLGAVAVGGVDSYRRMFGDLLTDVVFADSPYCYRCPRGVSYPSCGLSCAVEMEKMVEENASRVAAFIVEPMVQCPGGIITAPHGYLKRVRAACDKHGVLLIADEVATGFGRTGRMFACEHEDVQPDMMCLSKSLAAGVLPLAATLTTQAVFDAFLGDYAEHKTFYHGHTFTGHPTACAVALESLRLFRRKNVLGQVETKSQHLRDELIRLENLPHVGDIRQIGMVVGIELVKDRDAKEPYPASQRIGHKVILVARERGLIVRPLGDVIVLFPILASSNVDLKKMADILYESIAEVTGDFKGGKLGREWRLFP